ncbi:hypothetical protein EJ02DRAFT_460974 [Clathrospora elynae]|uniref:Myb/SANT-like domain-containing protein n=1 Tax=Clathrospora elynae TaxID=706981 RepID=A0A6A5S5E6_9PLEO|nr:hypothetical protein EJ02DRAFT_460974 [Clathrospora elynae]
MPPLLPTRHVFSVASLTSPLPTPSQRSQSQTPSQQSQSRMPRGSNIPRLTWTPLMERALLESLVAEGKRGQRSDNGYKKTAWETVRSELQHVAGPAKIVNTASCKIKLDSFKKDFREYVQLVS